MQSEYVATSVIVCLPLVRGIVRIVGEPPGDITV